MIVALAETTNCRNLAPWFQETLREGHLGRTHTHQFYGVGLY